MPLHAKRQSAKNVNPGFGMTLHTDQQSLILGDLITARDKLQEENQLLRDRLQDADMVIRLLHMKLEKAKAKNKSKKQTKSSSQDSTPQSDLPARSPRAAIDWISNTKHRKGKFKSPKKDAFKNKVAPGKKTFVAPKNIFEGTPAKLAAPARSSSVPRLSRSGRQTNASPARRRVEALEWQKALIKSETAKEEEEKIDEGGTHESIIGKLAQVVINEYGHSSDEEHLIFE